MKGYMMMLLPLRDTGKLKGTEDYLPVLESCVTQYYSKEKSQSVIYLQM